MDLSVFGSARPGKGEASMSLSVFGRVRPGKGEASMSLFVLGRARPGVRTKGGRHISAARLGTARPPWP